MRSFHWRRRWFRRWLANRIDTVPARSYSVRVLTEQRVSRERTLRRLRGVAHEALADAKTRLREPAKYSLDPLGAPDLALGYPDLLDDQTLKGYLGETFAGLVAENHDICGFNDWEMPAFLFRFHLEEFRQLERLRQVGGTARRQPGRTGDDCVAFRRDQEGSIHAVLVCEAKCSSDHNASLIANAHEKLSREANWRPLDTHQLLSIVASYDDPVSQGWTKSLATLLFMESRPRGWIRADCVVYVCGRRPKNANRPGWMPRDRPHPKYSRKRRLEALEVHLRAVDDVIKAIYRSAQ